MSTLFGTILKIPIERVAHERIFGRLYTGNIHLETLVASFQGDGLNGSYGASYEGAFLPEESIC
jgi:hypothetical protein